MHRLRSLMNFAPDKRHSKRSQLSDEMERQFEEKGIGVGVGVLTI